MNHTHTHIYRERALVSCTLSLAWYNQVALASEVGNENHTFSVTTVLGGKGGRRGIEAGDALLGYDLRQG